MLPCAQMTFRRLLAALVLLTLITGHPMAATPGAKAACGTSDMPATDASGGCCTGDIANCALACGAASAAVGETNKPIEPPHAGSPLDGAACSTRSFSRPPDTAPPKVLSA